MAKVMTKSMFTIGLLAVLLSVPAFAGTVNKSIKIEAGSETGSQSSVNGSITIGENAVVDGRVKTVNGSVRIRAGATVGDASTVNGGVKLGDRVSADSVETVNGGIKVGEAGKIDGSITAVNGRIFLDDGTTVGSDISNVNGHIELTGASVGGDMSTVTGDISLLNGSVVSGDLLVEKPKGKRWGKNSKKKPKIVIGPGSRVEGSLTFEHEVELYISDTADVGEIKGVMTMEMAVRFSGERP